MTSEQADKWYRALRNHDADFYHKAIQYAEGVSLNNDLKAKAALDCEISHVMLVCELLGVKP